MSQHIRVGGNPIAAVVAVLFVLGGIAIGLLGLLNLNLGMLVGGVLLFFIGFIIGETNMQVAKARVAQLSVDTQEAIRDKMRNACPNCGSRNPQGSRFCNNCGYELVKETEKEVVKEKEVIVKVRCPYCHKLYDETLDVCPHCGGTI